MKRLFRLSDSRPDPKRDVDDEIRFHLEMRAREFTEHGLAPEDALRAAAESFGDVAAIESECRDVRVRRMRERTRRDWMSALVLDVSFALRTLRKNKGFTLAAVLTLAIGIGSATAMFSVGYGVLIEPLPVAKQNRVVLVTRKAAADNSVRPFPVADLTELRSRSRVFESVAGVQYDGAFPYVTQDGDRPLSVMGTLVSGNFFRALGVRPVVGRVLEPDDGAAGAGRVVMISYALWQRQYGGDPAVVGRALRFHGGSSVVVGVAPRGFEYPKGVEMWVPLRLSAQVVTDRRFAPFSLVGRLRPGATIEQARNEVAAFLEQREAVYLPGEPRNERAAVIPFRDAIVGNIRPSILILSAAVALVLLIASMNVANLLLVRGAGREQEMAVRAALGAGRARIARQLLTESAVLAAGGGLLGVGCAYCAVRGLVAIAPPQLPRVGDVQMDARVLAFAVGSTIVSTLIFGLAPALWTAKARPQATLRSGARGGHDSRVAHFTKQALVAWQLSLAVVVVAGAGLLARSLLALQHVDMGFAAQQLTLVQVALPRGVSGDVSRGLNFFDQLAARTQSTPGIAAATPVLLGPFSGTNGWTADYTVEGQGETSASQNPTLYLEAASPTYFETLGIPIRRGRAFTEQDRKGSVPVAIVSGAVARRAWPGEDPLGKRLKLGAADSQEPWLTVIGVVGETRYRELAKEPPGIYMPFRQFAAGPGTLPEYLAVRSTASPGTIVSTVRNAAHELDPSTLVLDAHPVMQLAAAPLAHPRFNTLLFSGFAIVALVLATVGLYGVMASVVTQRTHEIGLRMALGAQIEDVSRLVLRQGMLLALVGVAIGTIATLALTRVFASILYDVRATDPATLIGVTLLLLGAAALACYLPARRATRVDPLVALRSE